MIYEFIWKNSHEKFLTININFYSSLTLLLIVFLLMLLLLLLITKSSSKEVETHILEKLKWISSKEKLLLSLLKVSLLKEWNSLSKYLLTPSIDHLSCSFLSLLMICLFLCSCFLIVTTLIIFFSFVWIRKNFISFSNKLKLCGILLFHFFSCILW